MAAAAQQSSTERNETRRGRSTDLFVRPLRRSSEIRLMRSWSVSCFVEREREREVQRLDEERERERGDGKVKWRGEEEKGKEG